MKTARCQGATAEVVFRELREYLAEEVARELDGDPKGSKAKWLLDGLETLDPARSRARVSDYAPRVASGRAASLPDNPGAKGPCRGAAPGAFQNVKPTEMK